MKLPKKTKDVFAYRLDWDLLNKYKTLDRVVFGWLSKKIKEMLHSEEIELVNLLIKKLAQKETPENMVKQLKSWLEEDTEDFVKKLWQVLIFEDMKAKEGLLR